MLLRPELKGNLGEARSQVHDESEAPNVNDRPVDVSACSVDTDLEYLEASKPERDVDSYGGGVVATTLG